MAPQIVLISGCSSGIGLATAVLLAKDAEKRFKVYATMRNLAKRGQLEEEGQDQLGDTLIVKQMDVSRDESVNQTIKELLDIEGRIDVLFNNAGFGLWSVVECTPIEMAKEMFDVNYFGTLRLIQAVLPSMKARKSGCIINNSSILGIVAAPFNAIYCSTKFAIEGLTEAIAPTLRHFNIRCSIIEPGPVGTSALENSRNWASNFEMSEPDNETQELFGKFAQRMSHQFRSTMQTSDEIAEVVKSVILNEKPNLRYQTNLNGVWRDVKQKLTDPTGNELMDMVKKAFLDAE